MLETKRPRLTVTEEPGGMLRKQLMDYDGTVLLDETVLPHDDLICFIHRPLKKYSQQLTELENHPLFKESLDISILDFRDLVAKCFAVANDLKTDFPEAYFLMRIALEDILVEEDDGSASFLLNTGTKMVQAVRALYFTRVRMRNIMEICFGTTESMTQEKRWTRTATVYPQLYTYAFSVRWKAEGDEWVREYEMHSLLELYFFEVCAALRSEKRIVRCQHCWQYFVPKTKKKTDYVPKTKKKTDYCDRTWEDGSTCKKRGPMISLISGVFGTSGCATITAGGFGGSGVSTAGSFCGHTAAHRTRQAANAAAVIIRFFILHLPFWIWKERPISSLYSERLSAPFHIDSVPWRAAMPAQIRK